MVDGLETTVRRTIEKVEEDLLREPEVGASNGDHQPRSGYPAVRWNGGPDISMTGPGGYIAPSWRYRGGGVRTLATTKHAELQTPEFHPWR